jgi:hypothetical protein
MPVTVPEPEPTEAIDVAVVVHVPPPKVLESTVAAPAQSVVVPVIAAGLGLTVMVALPAMSLEQLVAVLVAETV